MHPGNRPVRIADLDGDRAAGVVHGVLGRGVRRADRPHRERGDPVIARAVRVLDWDAADNAVPGLAAEVVNNPLGDQDRRVALDRDRDVIAQDLLTTSLRSQARRRAQDRRHGDGQGGARDAQADQQRPDDAVHDTLLDSPRSVSGVRPPPVGPNVSNPAMNVPGIVVPVGGWRKARPCLRTRGWAVCPCLSPLSAIPAPGSTMTGGSEASSPQAATRSPAGGRPTGSGHRLVQILSTLVS